MKQLIVLILSLIVMAAPAFAAESDYAKLANAIYLTEGGAKAKVPYGIFYKGCDWQNAQFCRIIAINTLKHIHSRFQAQTRSNDLLGPNNEAYIRFAAETYCPKSADPVGHSRWIKNVTYFLNHPKSITNLGAESELTYSGHNPAGHKYRVTPQITKGAL